MCPDTATDHIALYEETHRLLITGDLLFVGKVGGTSSDEAARVEWRSLQHLVAEIPDEATVWPGHDYGAQAVIDDGAGKISNPFLLCRDEEAFLQLKAGWPAFKQAHGLR